MNKHSRFWSLQEAKAKFSQLVRQAKSDGLQVVTVHGKEAVHIVPASDTRARGPSVDDILTAFQACPVKGFEIPRLRTRGGFRDVEF
ncbi:MAG: type II toxin-antitoxin system prevent-host-death family antitoxin [Rhizobiales bacterium]|nr:type II toxin-antitoxin system prevent-host-death family antitoxin [Hyphomicrobiales bacterium]MBI3673616.1 type II toxin-antitoxin system prevent-host-death family antitoxin [Hyphomicrobiales bacterium]